MTPNAMTMEMTVAVVSTALPPNHSGQAIVLERLLRSRDARFCFFSDNEEAFSHAPEERMGEYHRLRPLLFGISMRNFPGLIGDVNAYLGAMKPIRIRSREILLRLSNTRPDVIIGCSGNPFDIPSAALAAQRLGVPFIAYLFDDPVLQWPQGRLQNAVRRLEQGWTREAKHIICPNEALADLVRRRTLREPVIIRNPRDDAIAKASVGSDMREPCRPVRILYSGAVSESQGDALANLAKVVGRANGKYQLLVFTRQPESQLVKLGITGPYVYRRDHVNVAQIAAEREKADILFLPLSFHSAIQKVLMTSAPGKLGEYLASRRPILVHAPKGAFLSSFMLAHRAGRVVDTPSLTALEHALDELIENADLRKSLIDAAAEASRMFREDAARAQFWRLVAG